MHFLKHRIITSEFLPLSHLKTIFPSVHFLSLKNCFGYCEIKNKLIYTKKVFANFSPWIVNKSETLFSKNLSCSTGICQEPYNTRFMFEVAQWLALHLHRIYFRICQHLQIPGPSGNVQYFTVSILYSTVQCTVQYCLYFLMKHLIFFVNLC